MHTLLHDAGNDKLSPVRYENQYRMILCGGSDLWASDSPHKISTFVLNTKSNDFLKSGHQEVNINNWLGRVVFVPCWKMTGPLCVYVNIYAYIHEYKYAYLYHIYARMYIYNSYYKFICKYLVIPCCKTTVPLFTRYNSWWLAPYTAIGTCAKK